MASKPGTPKPALRESSQSVSNGSPPFGQGPLACPRCKQESVPPVDFCSRCGFSFLETRSLDAPLVDSTGTLVGQVINGKYRVLSLLGEGGFGVVYKVELLLFDTANLFALKLLHPSLSQDKNFRRRFLREAGLAMALIHENTIQIREFGQTEDGHLFFTMDYCAGEPLKAVIARERFLNVNRALHVARQILSVMKLAHARGIIHRDLKPENIFLEKDSEGRDFVKVGDFGLAKSFGSGEEDAQGRRRAGRGCVSPSEDISRGAILGTPRYMSPEQAMGREDLDDRSDLYSIGVVLYEMLYGRVPAERSSASRAGVDSVGSSPAGGLLRTPVPEVGHAVPVPVWRVVRKALEIEREDRFQSASEFLEAVSSLPQYTHAYSEPKLRRSRGAMRRVLELLGFSLAACALAFFVLRERGHFDFKLPWERSPPVARPVAFPASYAPAKEPSNAAIEVDGVAGEGVQSLQPSHLPRKGVNAYLQFRKGDVLRYQTYRSGVSDREVVYRILGESSPGSGVFTVSVSPGDRTFTWTIDEKKNEFYQEFQLPNPQTGALSEPAKRLRFGLPLADAIVDRYYIDGELRMKMEPENLLLPSDPKLAFEKFAGCLRVESHEEGRIHFEYFQEGKGLVGIEVYDSKESASAPASERKTPIYASYLIEHTHAEERPEGGK